MSENVEVEPMTIEELEEAGYQIHLGGEYYDFDCWMPDGVTVLSASTILEGRKAVTAHHHDKERLRRLDHLYSRIDYYERTFAHDEPDRFIASVISELYAYDEFPGYGKTETENK